MATSRRAWDTRLSQELPIGPDQFPALSVTCRRQLVIPAAELLREASASHRHPRSSHDAGSPNLPFLSRLDLGIALKARAAEDPAADQDPVPQGLVGRRSGLPLACACPELWQALSSPPALCPVPGRPLLCPGSRSLQSLRPLQSRWLPSSAHSTRALANRFLSMALRREGLEVRCMLGWRRAVLGLNHGGRCGVRVLALCCAACPCGRGLRRPSGQV